MPQSTVNCLKLRLRAAQAFATRAPSIWTYMPCRCCQFRQRTDFIGPVDSAQLRTLRDIKSSRLGMMLLAKMTKIRTYQLRSQLSVGSGNRTNLTACHAGRSAAIHLHKYAQFPHILPNYKDACITVRQQHCCRFH